MATVTHVCTIDYVAKMLDEDPELLEAIVYNDDNLSYGSIVSVYTSPEDTITALTDDGIDELKDMLRNARSTTETWHAFLDDFVDDTDLVARIKAKSPREQPAGYRPSHAPVARRRGGSPRPAPARARGYVGPKGASRCFFPAQIRTAQRRAPAPRAGRSA
jgi:hypothetical protein